MTNSILITISKTMKKLLESFPYMGYKIEKYKKDHNIYTILLFDKKDKKYTFVYHKNRTKKIFKSIN